MSNFLTRPSIDKYSMALEDDKVRVGVTSMQGWRPTMEDAHCVALELPHLKQGLHSDAGALLSIFDGHCGGKIAQLASQHILQWVTSSESFKKQRYADALCKGFLKGDAFLRTEHPEEKSGATANAVLMVGGRIFCANAGDSRAVMSRGGKAFDLSTDHKPSQKLELERIIRAGGFVTPQGRIYGVLALSRALGDFNFKQNEELPAEEQVVTAMPDVLEVNVKPEDEFIVMACDGIWDVMSSQEAVDYVRDELNNHGDALLAAERLTDMCLAPTPMQMGTDNMTVMVVQFKGDYLRTFAFNGDEEGSSPLI